MHDGLMLPVSFPVGFRKIEQVVFEGIREDFIQHKTSERYNLFSPQISNLSLDLSSRQFDKIDPSLIRIFDVILKRQDVIISILSLLTSGDKGKGLPCSAVCKEIGGEGLKIVTTDSFESEEYLELLIDIPTFPKMMISSIGEIKDIKTIDKGYMVLIKFAAINSDDREELIGYLFKRQRELLRKNGIRTLYSK